MVPKVIITREHLVDDYTLSRNIAKYGLKHTTIMQIQRQRADNGNYLWHGYTITEEEKVKQIGKMMKAWQIEHFAERAQHASLP